MASRTCSYVPIESVVYCPRKDGSAEVWLHENIEETVEERPDEEETLVLYTADETHFITRHSRQYIEDHFDELWIAAERADQPLSERIAELEDQLGAAIDVLLAMSEEV